MDKVAQMLFAMFAALCPEDYANAVSKIETPLDKAAKEKWHEFEDVPMDPETECIEQEWNGFPEGTHREEIWHWFEENYGVRVYDLMYGDEENDE